MLARLESARNSQQRFVSDASHELRSSITTIRQHAEVALAYPDRTSIAELAEVVLAEELRIQRLVEDLLPLARADEQVWPPREPVDVDDLAFEEARRVRSMTSSDVDTSGVGAARVHGDTGTLERVLRDLGENAARHATSRIDIALAERGSEMLLSFDDDGPGIPEQERERMLQRFVRLDESRSRDEGGSGFGLAIVDEILRAHGGSGCFQVPWVSLTASTAIAEEFSMRFSQIGVAVVGVGTLAGWARLSPSREVEVTLGDGSQTDVQLDPNFVVVDSKTDGPGTDDALGAPDGGGPI